MATFSGRARRAARYARKRARQEADAARLALKGIERPRKPLRTPPVPGWYEQARNAKSLRSTKRRLQAQREEIGRLAVRSKVGDLPDQIVARRLPKAPSRVDLHRAAVRARRQVPRPAKPIPRRDDSLHMGRFLFGPAYAPTNEQLRAIADTGRPGGLS